MKPVFVGRREELRLLSGFLARPNPAIAVVYGRRRIGKSLLIQTALSGRTVLTFEGLENQPKPAQIDAFLLQLNRQTGVRGRKTKAWREALMLLEPVLRQNPACVVLDELQWMANYRHDLVSDLKMVWEQCLARIPGVKLILCGSVASFMTAKVVRSSALYGRTDLEIHLKGFQLDETRTMLADRGLDEVIEAALYFNGVPKYLDLLRPYPSARLAVEELAFRENGYFVEEYDRIFASHFGRNPDFRWIVETLAAHPQGLFRKELAKRAGVDEGGTLSEHLADLESAGFIASLTPFDRSRPSRLLRYVLSDAYMRFYFAFIRPNLHNIRSGQREIFSRLSQTGLFQDWRGRAFEHLCATHTQRIARVLGFSGVDFVAGPYFRPPTRARGGVQVDLLFSRADNVITLCEMKCSVSPIPVGVVKEVERKAQFLQRLFPSKTIQKVLVVHGEASRDLETSGYFYRIVKSADLLVP